jgi:chemotaxis protein CheD
VHIIQGEFRISDDPEVMFSTLLGSCVAACIRDPLARVGGMNHFLLPGSSGQSGDGERYGVHAMEMLINGLLGRGADRRRLEVKLFGGAKTMRGLADIGDQNARFARAFVEAEGLRVVGECLGGVRGRRLQFWPVAGRARRSFLAETDHVPVRVAPAPAVADAGALELF